MGETNNTVSYRRLSILSSLMNPPPAKSLLKDKAAILLSQDANLFGKEFRQHLVGTVKAKKQSKEVASKISLTNNYMKTKPFQSVSSRKSARDGGSKIITKKPIHW